MQHVPGRGANCGPGSKISYLLPSFITSFNEEAEDESQGEFTENLQAAIEEFNGKEVKEEVKLYSMDAKASPSSLIIFQPE